MSGKSGSKWKGILALALIVCVVVFVLNGHLRSEKNGPEASSGQTIGNPREAGSSPPPPDSNTSRSIKVPSDDQPNEVEKRMSLNPASTLPQNKDSRTELTLESLTASLKKLSISQEDLKRIQLDLQQGDAHHTPASYLDLASRVAQVAEASTELQPLADCARAHRVLPDFYSPLSALCLSFLHEISDREGASSDTKALFERAKREVTHEVLEISTAAMSSN